jgi:very-short-patch-repair endonuclease
MCTRREIERACDSGLIVRTARGSYALASIEEGRRLAHATGGVLCLSSAALAHGWKVKQPPRHPQICYPKHRRLAPELRRRLAAHWVNLDASEIDGYATSPGKTLEMCARSLPYDEALAIADSALRSGEQATLTSLRHARGRGAARIRRVVSEASPLADNPFESVLRAIAAGVPGLDVDPQVWIGSHRCDLVDEQLRIVAEADSFEWHGKRAALRRDANRYNELVVADWMVLRFSWEDVMGEPKQVRQTLEQAVATAQLRTKLPKMRS